MKVLPWIVVGLLLVLGMAQYVKVSVESSDAQILLFVLLGIVALLLLAMARGALKRKE